MKSTTHTSELTTSFPTKKLELSKYRSTQAKTDSHSAKKQSQPIAKPSPSYSKKSRDSVPQQPNARKTEPRHNTGKAGASNVVHHRPFFSIFFAKEESSASGIPIHSEVSLPSEQDEIEKKPVVKKRTIEVVQPKELSRNAKKEPKVQVWSFLDLSDKEDEGSLGGNSTVFGSRKSLRNTEQTLTTSEMTTMPDEETVKEDMRRCNTEYSESTSKSNSDRSSFENMKLKTRVKELEDKIGKWELFGRLMTKCYQTTRKERNEYKVQNELDKKNIAALKEQVSTLKTLSKTEKANTAKALKKAAQDSEETQVLVFALRAMEMKLSALSNENKDLKQQILSLKGGKESQKADIKPDLENCASRKKVTFWEPTDDIDTPSPRTFKMKPLVKESDVHEIVN